MGRCTVTSPRGPPTPDAPTSPNAHRLAPRSRTEWALLLAAGLVTAVTAALLVLLGARSNDARRAELDIARAETLVARQATLEWQAIADHRVTPALLASLERLRAGAADRLDAAASHSFQPEAVATAHSLLGSYETAVDEELRLLDAGRVAEAKTLDERLVDPRFEEVGAQLGVLSADAGARADEASLVQRVGTLAGLAACLLIVALFFWRFQVTRRTRDLRDQEEALLRQSEARHRSLVQNSSDVITVVGEDGRIRDQSASVERVLGYEPGHLLGTNILDLAHPADAARLLAALSRRAAAGKAPIAIDLRLSDRSGHWRDTETTVTDLRDDAGVAGIVLTSHDVGERKALQEQLAHQAFHDALTGLANRVLFSDRLEHALRRCGEGESVGVLFIDLDDFKTVNDSLGHAVGDAVLVTAAERLRTIVRPADTVARLGGDEFAILVESVVSPADVERMAERLIDAIEEPAEQHGHELRAQASVGIVFAEGGTATSEELLRNADVAMYAAKTAGKGRFAVFAPEMHSALIERLEMAADLKLAIDDGQMRVHYQPIVDLSDDSIVGVEALVRWEHPSRGLVSPAAFIPLAEETGLIVPLGRWVLDTACHQMGEWNSIAPSGRRLRLSVNLSERQLHDVQLVADVEDALNDSGMDPDDLVLELTESALIEERGDTVARLNALKTLGVRLAVDDFGVGYSSLRYLHRLPVDELKVDKSFVDHVHQGPEHAALAEAIVALGQRLSLDTVAEGIETPDQVEALRALGCVLGQGFRFARPLTAGAMTDLLAAERAGSAVWSTAV